MNAVQYLIKIDSDGKAAIVEANKVTAAMASVDNSASKVSKAIGLLSSSMARFLGVALVGRELKQTWGDFSKMWDDAARAQVDPEKWQAWAFALNEIGESAETAANGIKFLRVAQSDAAQALASGKENEATKAFRALGISPEIARNAPAENLLEAVAGQIQKVKGPERVGIAQALFGRGWEGMLNAADQGFTDQAGKARRLGLVLPKAQLEEMDRADDELKRMRLQTRVLEAKGLSSAARDSLVMNYERGDLERSGKTSDQFWNQVFKDSFLYQTIFGWKQEASSDSKRIVESLSRIESNLK